MTPHRPSGARTERIYRALLRLYPPGYRRAYGTEMLAAFSKLHCDRRESGLVGYAGFCLRELLGLLVGAARERLAIAERSEASLEAGDLRHPGLGLAFLRLEAWAQDSRSAVRSLLKSPLVTTVCVITLALGIGANAVIYSGVDALFLRPLLGRDAASLVMLERPGLLSYPEYRTLRDNNGVFTGLAATAFAPARVSAGGLSSTVMGEFVSANYFDVIGLRPVLGRSFVADEDEGPGQHPVAILSHAFWTNRFGADPGVLGSTIRVSGRPFTVVGVTREDVKGALSLFPTDVWMPLMMWEAVVPASTRRLSDPSESELLAIGRLRPGVRRGAAEEAIRARDRAWRVRQAGLGEGRGGEAEEISLVRLRGMTGWMRDMVAPFAGLLVAVVGLVLLIACANVANLLLVRAESRKRELAIRAALGASRYRLTRQLLVESLIISVIGAAVGFLLAIPAVDVLLWFETPSNPSMPTVLRPDFRMDHRVLAATLGLSLLTTIFFGLLPVRRVSRPNVIPELKDGGLGAGSGSRRRGPQAALVVVQVSLSLMLVITAGLTAKGLIRSYRIDPGFDPERGLVVTVGLDEEVYSEAAGQELYRAIQARVTELPGVLSAGWASYIPVSGGHPASTIEIEGPQGPRLAEARVDIAGSRFLEALGTPPVRGRGFEDAEAGSPSLEIMVNERLASWAWPGQDPLGKSLRIGEQGSVPVDAPYLEVVGVVPDMLYANSFEGAYSVVYTPLTLRYAPSLALLIRTVAEPEPLIPLVRDAVLSTDAALAIHRISTLFDHATSTVAPLRMIVRVAIISGMVALILALVGVYGVIAYSVASRTREMGVRMALGARRHDVRRLVVGQGLRLIVVGVAIGAPGAVALNRALSVLLYGVSPVEGLLLASAAGLVAATGLLASYVPSWRATRLDPVSSLRI